MRHSSRDLTGGAVTPPNTTGTGLYDIDADIDDEFDAVNRMPLAILWGLYLLGIATGGALTVVGVIYAYYHRKRTLNDIELSHCDYAIKTFWRTLIWGLIGAVLILVAVGFLVLIIVGLWHVLRCLKGALRAFNGAPMYPLPRL